MRGELLVWVASGPFSGESRFKIDQNAILAWLISVAELG